MLAKAARRAPERALEDRSAPAPRVVSGSGPSPEAQGPVLLAESSDLELLAHVMRGEQRAWRVFHRRFHGLIYSCAVKASTESGFYLDSEELSDIVQEVSLRMVDRDFRRLRMYRSDAGTSVATWVGVIAFSTTKDCVRRLRRQRAEVMTESELDRMVSEDAGPEETLEDREQKAFVDARLGELSRRDQEFVRLYFMEAHPAEEVAALMGISVSTVYSKKAKIAARLAGWAREGGEASCTHPR